MGQYKDLATCMDCGTKRLVRHREWIRASRPRCMACGGPLEQSAMSAEQHASHYDAELADRVKRDRKTNRKNRA